MHNCLKFSRRQHDITGATQGQLGAVCGGSRFSSARQSRPTGPRTCVCLVRLGSRRTHLHRDVSTTLRFVLSHSSVLSSRQGGPLIHYSIPGAVLFAATTKGFCHIAKLKFLHPCRATVGLRPPNLHAHSRTHKRPHSADCLAATSPHSLFATSNFSGTYGRPR